MRGDLCEKRKGDGEGSMKDLTHEMKQSLLAPFEAAEIRIKVQPFIAAYITARVVMTRLDEVIPWQWSFKLIGPGVLDPNEVMHQDGVLTVQHPDGTENLFYDRGSAPKDLAKGQAKQAKHAVSDCFKRCAVHVGIGRYLYELTGIVSGRIPKGALEKALAAVGYTGPWDDRHHGGIGGIREADLEDDFGEVPTQPATPVAPPAAPPKANGNRPRMKLSDAEKERIKAFVPNLTAAPFLGWLKKNTANNAESVEDILAEDVEEVLRKLQELADKKAAS
jgi:hypothetical protein